MENVNQFLDINSSDNFFSRLGDRLVYAFRPYKQYSDLLQDLKTIPQLILKPLQVSVILANQIISLPFFVIICFLDFLNNCIESSFRMALKEVTGCFMKKGETFKDLSLLLALAVLSLPIALISLFSKSLCTLFNGPQEASGFMRSHPN